MRSAAQSGRGLPIRRTRVIFTSTRDAPVRVRSFLNELEDVIPFSKRINRGRQSLDAILRKAKFFQASYLVVVGIRKGNPWFLLVYDLYTSSLKYNLRILGVTLRKEILKVEKDSKKVRKGCIGSIEHDTIKKLLLDLGYYSISSCDAYAYGEVIITEDNRKLYQVKFLDNQNNILGPIIRFDYNEGIDRNQI